MLSLWYFELLVNYVLLKYDYEKEKLSHIELWYD